jgi:hypothetical protein
MVEGNQMSMDLGVDLSENKEFRKTLGTKIGGIR